MVAVRRGLRLGSWWFATAFALAFVEVPGSVRAQPAPHPPGRPRLRFEVPPRAGCPPEGDFRAAVRDDFGYDFFATDPAREPPPPQPLPWEVVVRVTTRERRLSGTLVLVARDGREETFAVPAGPGGCRAVLGAVLVRFNTLMDARLLAAPPPPPNPSPPSPGESRDEPIATARSAVEPERPAPAALRAGGGPVGSDAGARWMVEVLALTFVSAYALPEIRPGLALGVRLARGPWSLGLEALTDLPLEVVRPDGSWSLQRWAGVLLGCRRWGPVALCALTRAGGMFGRGGGLMHPAEGMLPVLDLGARVTVTLPLGRRVAVVASLEGVGVVAGGAFTARREGSTERVELWHTRGASLAGAVGVLVRVW